MSIGVPPKAPAELKGFPAQTPRNSDLAVAVQYQTSDLWPSVDVLNAPCFARLNCIACIGQNATKHWFEVGGNAVAAPRECEVITIAGIDGIGTLSK